MNKSEEWKYKVREKERIESIYIYLYFQKQIMKYNVVEFEKKCVFILLSFPK